MFENDAKFQEDCTVNTIVYDKTCVLCFTLKMFGEHEYAKTHFMWSDLRSVRYCRTHYK